MTLAFTFEIRAMPATRREYALQLTRRLMEIFSLKCSKMIEKCLQNGDKENISARALKVVL